VDRQAQLVDQLYKGLKGRAAIVTGTPENLIKNSLINEGSSQGDRLPGRSGIRLDQDREELKRTLLSQGHGCFRSSVERPDPERSCSGDRG
jgi:hypothetical protein